MLPNPRTHAYRISLEAGLEFEGSEGHDSEGRRWLELCPAGHPKGQTFAIRTTIGWRRLDVSFRPGNFAQDLLAAMGTANETGRATFLAVLDECHRDGAEIDFILNGVSASPSSIEVWASAWRSMQLTVMRGMLAINEGDVANDIKLIERWTLRATAAILGLLPLELEEEDSAVASGALGLPEGARLQVEVNRYERDRRNRAAALSIHGYACKACDRQLDTQYGDAAMGLIEIHHLTPVSKLGPDYIINPKEDLIPLCPNCHSVAHRRSPPFSVQELRAMLSRNCT